MSSALQTLCQGLNDSLAVITRSQLFFKLALIMAATGMVFECIMELLLTYLSFTMSFGPSQNASILIVLGVSGLLVQVCPVLHAWHQPCTVFVHATSSSSTTYVMQSCVMYYLVWGFRSFQS